MPMLTETESESSVDRSGNVVTGVRRAAMTWSQLPLKHRLKCLQRLRARIVESAGEFIEACSHLPHRCPGETLAAEIIPLADAAKFLVRNAGRILRTTSRRSFQLQIVTERRPLGVIFIISPGNFPLFLPGVQVLQALTAGNGVILKPGQNGIAAAMTLKKTLHASGVPDDLIHVMPEAIDGVRQVISAGVNKIIVTGSQRTGRVISSLIAAARPTAAVMELSGADAAIVLAEADIQRAAAAVAFGLTFNAGNICMAPRRIFADRAIVDRFVVALQESLNQCPRFDLNIPGLAASAQYLDEAIDSGAEIIYGRWDSHTRWGPLVIRGISMSSPIFCTGEMAPIAGVNAFSDLEDLFLQYAQVSMRLGASIFGDRRSARHLANQIDAGCICINDLLAPTAHPAVCLAPREESGYGATRGPEGLLEMTSPVTIANRTGHFLPHLSRVNVEKPVPLRNILALKHSPHLRTRLNSLLRVIQGR